MNLDLNGKIAIVTGAGRGHGESIAIALADEGAVSIVIDINTENAKKVASDIKARGGSSVAYGLDITIMKDVQAMMQEVHEQLGRIDLLINNACAPIRKTPFLEMKEEEWSHVIAVNLKGTFNCSQAAGSIMKTQGHGRMINMSSFAAGLPAVGFAAYSASKAGIEALSKTVAGELGEFGITVLHVRPGVIETEFTKPGHQGETGERMRASIASRRFGTSEELAKIICFLASPVSEYINGGPILIDGGKYVCQV